MSNSPVVDYTQALWKIIHNDNSIVTEGGKNDLDKINRSEAKTFELHSKGKTIFTYTVNGRAIIHRRRRIRKLFFPQNGAAYMDDPRFMKTVRIIAFLKKKKDLSKNRNFHLDKAERVQDYSFDPTLSDIFFMMPDGKIQKTNTFLAVEPFTPPFLRDDELHSLNGSL